MAKMRLQKKTHSWWTSFTDHLKRSALMYSFMHHHQPLLLLLQIMEWRRRMIIIITSPFECKFLFEGGGGGGGYRGLPTQRMMGGSGGGWRLVWDLVLLYHTQFAAAESIVLRSSDVTFRSCIFKGFRLCVDTPPVFASQSSSFASIRVEEDASPPCLLHRLAGQRSLAGPSQPVLLLIAHTLDKVWGGR